MYHSELYAIVLLLRHFVINGHPHEEKIFKNTINYDKTFEFPKKLLIAEEMWYCIE